MDAKNLRDSKISNIAITIDKVMHVLKSMETDEPPIKEMTYKEVNFDEIILYRGMKKYGLAEIVSRNH
jgi:hypothetical protein